MMYDSEENPEHPDHTPARDLSPRLAEDQFYQALASVHRRRLLHHLLENGESTVEELASVLSGWELSSSGTMHTQAERSTVVLGLQHNHLPRLDEAGLIEYDTEADTVQLESVHPRVNAIIRQSVAAERLDPRE